MWIKKLKTAVLALLVFAGGTVFGQQRDPIDLVLLLDTSSGMSRYYGRTSHYLTGSFLRDNLRLGDTFHLIAFSDRPRLEIARRVEGRGDLETVIARMLLMYPLEPGGDLPAALSFAEDYLENLSPLRGRKLLILSQGEAPGLEQIRGRLEQGRTSLERINPADLPEAAAPRPVVSASPAASPAPAVSPPPARAPEPRPAPATPSPPAPEPQRTAPPPTAAPAVPPPLPEPARTAPAPEPPPSRSPEPPAAPQPAPVVASPPTADPEPAAPARTALPEPVMPEPEVPAEAPLEFPPAGPPDPEAAPPPVSTPEPAASAPEPPVSTPAARPAAETPPRRQAPRAPREPGPLRLFFAGLGAALVRNYRLLLAGLLILAALVSGFFLIRRLRRSFKRRTVRTKTSGTTAAGTMTARTAAAGPVAVGTTREPKAGVPRESPARRPEPYRPPPRKSPYAADRGRPLIKPEYGSPFLLKLFVEDQNALIGKRNTHLVKPGLSYSVGGGRSDFLIFLVSVPPRIGEVRYESSGCTFYPLKPRYFPELGSTPLPDCIGKTIRVVSDRGYELSMRLEPYEDPLLELNRLMLSIKVPNPPEARPL